MKENRLPKTGTELREEEDKEIEIFTPGKKPKPKEKLTQRRKGA